MKQRTDALHIVWALMELYPETRDDDFTLYYEYLRNADPRALVVTMGKYLQGHNRYGKYSPATITRARRRVNALYPETRGKSYENRRAAQEKYQEMNRAVVD